MTSGKVNFAYKEDGKMKNALVKLRLCSKCEKKLNYKNRQKKQKKLERKMSKLKRKGKYETLRDSKRKKLSQDDDVGSSGHVESVNSIDTEAVESSQSSDIWTKPAVVEESVSREDEFEEFFRDLFP